MKEPYEGQTAVVLGTLRGYRFWRFDNVDLQLYPVHINLGPWTPGLNVAFCASDPAMSDLPSSMVGGHAGHHNNLWSRMPAPQIGCTCGIYATYDPKYYRVHRPRFWINYGPDFPPQIIHGSITATGRVVLGEKGFKAAKAQIEGLWGWRAKKAAEIYEVPWFRTRRRFLKEFPPHNVSSLLEE